MSGTIATASTTATTMTAILVERLVMRLRLGASLMESHFFAKRFGRSDYCDPVRVGYVSNQHRTVTRPRQVWRWRCGPHDQFDVMPESGGEVHEALDGEDLEATIP
jgi:hypothetical protein